MKGSIMKTYITKEGYHETCYSNNTDDAIINDDEHVICPQCGLTITDDWRGTSDYHCNNCNWAETV